MLRANTLILSSGPATPICYDLHTVSMAMRTTHDHRDRFSNHLLCWYDIHKRPLPWRKTGDPYAIWVSEIMLQQTQVERVINYYQRFLKYLPDLYSLAQASETKVLSLWSGLGYYRRARHLHRAAQLLCDLNLFQLPSTHRELEYLPGIGSYTARAIASIAYGDPVAVVDGNVKRVLIRYYGLKRADQTTVQRLQKRADALVDRQRPGDFNEAMMELGATLCKPIAPLCQRCPFVPGCYCAKHQAWNRLPAPTKKPASHFMHGALYMLTETNSKKDDDPSFLLTTMAPAPLGGSGRFEFPVAWTDTDSAATASLRTQLKEVGTIRHAITHHRITLTCYTNVMERVAAPTKLEAAINKLVPTASQHWTKYSQLVASPPQVGLSSLVGKALQLLSI